MLQYDAARVTGSGVEMSLSVQVERSKHLNPLCIVFFLLFLQNILFQRSFTENYISPVGSG